MTGEVLCIGEVLWDIFPSGRFLGGAPLNVACHLRALGVPAQVVSRVGNDDLGREILERLQGSGISTEFIQRDNHLPTGRVNVSFQCPQTPEYEIVKPASWDAIEYNDALGERAARARAIVFGSLAQRSEPSRGTIRRLLKSHTLRVFDINLRHPYDHREVVEDSLQHSDFVKLNANELDRLRDWFDLGGGAMADTAAAVARRFGCQSVCITRGSDGAAWWHHGHWHEHPGYRVTVVDTVGSGDSFLAALMAGLLAGGTPDEILRHANAVGAYVATQRGATPSLDHQVINDLARSVEPVPQGTT